MAEEAKPLKHLAFVHTYSARLAGGAAYVEKAYSVGKGLVPNRVEPLVTKVEDAVRAYAAPVVASASDSAEKLLRSTDESVDQLYLTSAKYLSLQPLRDLHTSNVAVFRASFEKYSSLVKSTSDYLTTKLSSELSVQRAREALGQALDKAQEMADPDTAVRTVYDAWMQFATIPAVARTLQTAAPITTRGLEAFGAAHDALVSSPLYKRSVSLGASTLGWAAGTTPYRLGATYLYPLVQPVADPALDKVSKSTFVNATLKYWAPVAAPVAAA